MKLSERVGKELRQWELEIWKLYQQGVEPREAVRQAYKKHPVFDYVRENIKAELPEAARRGYGSEPPADTAERLADIPWSKDGLNLSQRTTRGSKKVVAAVGDSLVESIRRGRSVTAAAMDIFDGYSKGGIIPEQDIPKFMDKLLKIAPARDYGGTEYKAVLRSARRKVEQLSTRSLKAAYTEVIEAIESGNEDLAQKAIHVATQEKTRYFAERIARTELSRAYFDGFLAKNMGDPDVAAFRVHLSTRHPETDICDLYANADLFGMGKGIFPKDKLPDYPFHPNCMCRWEPLIRGSRKLKRDTPKPQIEAGVNSYLRKLSNGSREQILGVNGAKQYAKTGEWKENLLNWKEPSVQGSRLEAPAYKPVKAVGGETRRKLIQDIARARIVLRLEGIRENKYPSLRKSLKAYTEPELAALSNDLNEAASRHTTKETKWTGRVNRVSDIRYMGKSWTCDIDAPLELAPGSLLHELLHSRSISHYDYETFRKYAVAEESAVEYFTKEISIKEKIPLVASSYDPFVTILRRAARFCGYKDYDFAKMYFEQDVKERVDWLSDIVYSRGVELRKTMEETEKMQRIIGRAFYGK